MDSIIKEEASDQTLVQGCLAGDREAFTELMERHVDKVRGVIHNIVLNPTDTDDLTQETFLAAYRSLRGYRGGSALSTWLCGIAVNKACSYVRKQTYRRKALQLMDRGGVGSRHPDADLLATETRKEIDAAIEQLPVNLKAVIVLNVIEGHSGADVAKMCDCSTAVVYWRLHQARKHLHKTLRGGEEETLTWRTES